MYEMKEHFKLFTSEFYNNILLLMDEFSLLCIALDLVVNPR